MSDASPRNQVCLLILLAGLVGCGETRNGTTFDDQMVAERVEQWPRYQAPRVVEIGGLPGDRPYVETPLSEMPSPPWVITSRDEWDLETTAADSLSRIGEPAVPALIQSLRSNDPGERVRAAEVLARIGPAAKNAVPFLVQSLRDPDEDVRRLAARALGQIGPAAADAVGPLMNMLKEPARRPLSARPLVE